MPGVAGDIALEHWHRYHIARELVLGKDVLDIASGEGYGSWLLAGYARSVVGVDVDSRAVKHAAANYKSDNLHFKVGDCTAMPLADASVDVVVSFETLEHHARHEEMFGEIKRVLRPNGVLVISTPDREEYSVNANFSNHYHVRELSRAEFETLIFRHFKHYRILGQRVLYGSAILGNLSPAPALTFDIREPGGKPFIGLSRPIYLIAVASDGEVPPLNDSLMEQPVFETEKLKHLTALIENEREAAAKEFERLNEVIVVEREAAHAERVAAHAERLAVEAELARRASVWWFLRLLVRRAKLIGQKLLGYPKVLLIRLLRGIYHALPCSVTDRNRLKGGLYRCLPILFEHTLSYQLWKTQIRGVASTDETFELPQGVGQPFTLNCPENPVVSVVIPVYGEIEYTYQCLRSLWSHRSQYSFEVIVVDDCSLDNTNDVLQTIDGLRLVRNEQNSGFILSCNHGASMARGKLLVMLNNDTIVRPGWLDELVNTFNRVPKAGLVGSKLVYPNGSLQEAGGIIWKDGSGWNYGRQKDPNRPEFCYLREVDYCSGASIMITKQLFDRLGGFDVHYLPAYGEDSDLAFRVRQAGHKVLYQPLSKVVHFEGITSGKEVSSGVKAYQAENAKKLYQRWAAELEKHGEPGAMPELAKDRGIGGRALVLDHCTPTPDQDAGSITLVNLIRLLQGLRFKVTFAPEDNFLYIDPYTKDLQRIGVECLYAPYVTSLERHLAEHGTEYNVIAVFRLLAAERNLAAIRRYCPNARIVFHTSDLHFLREQRAAELENSEELCRAASKTMERELRVIREVDATIVHSTHEKELLDRELGSDREKSKVFLFSWAIDIPGTRSPYEARDGIVFVGGFQHLPNVDAAVYFANEIFPLVRRGLPNAIFRIVGSRAPQEILALAGDGIEVLGYIADLSAVLDRCRMSVAPLRYGAGIKGKIGTSLSFGLPCVSTTLGAEGMGLQDGDGVLVADETSDFAAAVIRLHQDRALWESSSRGGLAFAQNNYSLQAGIETVRSILSSAGVAAASLPNRNINLLEAERTFAADCPHDPMETSWDARSQTEFGKYVALPAHLQSEQREYVIIAAHAVDQQYHLPGYCRVCERNVDFLVDRQCGAVEIQQGWLPNWRERLVCPSCGLNNRQRMMAFTSRNLIHRCRDMRPNVYLMEQITPIFNWISNAMPQANCIGSEYLGSEIEPGKVVKGIRHEDVERLSFADNSFDIVISNDVLEHVADPKAALTEACRVLRPRGVLLITVPFYVDKAHSERRAKLVQGKLENILPPVYHGNPVSDDGSLVFTDFGWDFLQDIRDAGFVDTWMRFYWSETYGHLGSNQHYIQAVKG